MFGDVNEVRIMGNITRDLEVRTVSTGTSVCNFSVATNRRYQQNDEWKEEVEFHNVVLWGPRAESFAQRARKGTRVYIEGRLQTRSWEDQNGSKQFKTEIVVNRIILIDRYERGEGFSADGEQDGQGGQQGRNGKDVSSKRTAKRIEKKAKSSSDANDDEEIDPDDLPF
jgi:single-strand DNA-binding protein